MLNDEVKQVYQIARAVAREEIAKALDELKAQAVPAPASLPVEENKEEEDEF